jgi:hypothetical protein
VCPAGCSAGDAEGRTALDLAVIIMNVPLAQLLLDDERTEVAPDLVQLAMEQVWTGLPQHRCQGGPISCHAR